MKFTDYIQVVLSLYTLQIRGCILVYDKLPRCFLLPPISVYGLVSKMWALWGRVWVILYLGSVQHIVGATKMLIIMRSETKS